MAIRAVGFDILGVLATISSDGRLIWDDRLVDLAEQLQAAGYRTGILSNLSGVTSNRLREHVGRHFDAILLSGETGHVKPQPAAFELLASSLGVSADELIFIDDSPANLSRAHQVSLTGLVYTSYDDLLKQLQAHGIHLGDTA